MIKSLIASMLMSWALVVTASAQDTNPSVEDLLSNVTELAGNLQKTVGTLGERIESSANSAEEGTKILDDMLAAATQLNDSLGRDSEIWLELNDLMETWRGKRDDLLERSGTNSALKPIADSWQVRIDTALELRGQILEQSAESEALVEQIANQREVVLALYDAEAADAVLATMRTMSDELGRMNKSMVAILEQTGAVADPAASISSN